MNLTAEKNEDTVTLEGEGTSSPATASPVAGAAFPARELADDGMRAQPKVNRLPAFLTSHASPRMAAVAPPPPAFPPRRLMRPARAMDIKFTLGLVLLVFVVNATLMWLLGDNGTASRASLSVGDQAVQEGRGNIPAIEEKAIDSMSASPPAFPPVGVVAPPTRPAAPVPVSTVPAIPAAPAASPVAASAAMPENMPPPEAAPSESRQSARPGERLSEVERKRLLKIINRY